MYVIYYTRYVLYFIHSIYIARKNTFVIYMHMFIYYILYTCMLKCYIYYIYMLYL